MSGICCPAYQLATIFNNFILGEIIMINLILGLMIGLTLMVFYWFVFGIGVVAPLVAIILIATGLALGLMFMLALYQIDGGENDSGV